MDNNFINNWGNKMKNYKYRYMGSVSLNVDVDIDVWLVVIEVDTVGVIDVVPLREFIEVVGVEVGEEVIDKRRVCDPRLWEGEFWLESVLQLLL